MQSQLNKTSAPLLTLCLSSPAKPCFSAGQAEKAQWQLIPVLNSFNRQPSRPYPRTSPLHALLTTRSERVRLCLLLPPGTLPVAKDAEKEAAKLRERLQERAYVHQTREDAGGRGGGDAPQARYSRGRSRSRSRDRSRERDRSRDRRQSHGDRGGRYSGGDRERDRDRGRGRSRSRSRDRDRRSRSRSRGRGGSHRRSRCCQSCLSHKGGRRTSPLCTPPEQPSNLTSPLRQEGPVSVSDEHSELCCPLTPCLARCFCPMQGGHVLTSPLSRHVHSSSTTV